MKFKDFTKEKGISTSGADGALYLGNLILGARIKAGLTQEELAKKMGSRQATLSRFERGEQEPSISFLERVAEAVNTRLIPPAFESMSKYEDGSCAYTTYTFTLQQKIDFSDIKPVIRQRTKTKYLMGAESSQNRVDYSLSL